MVLCRFEHGVVAALACSFAWGQDPMPDRVRPDSFMWQKRPADLAANPQSRLAAMQVRDVHSRQEYYCNPGYPWPPIDPTPANAAILLTYSMKLEFLAGRIVGEYVGAEMVDSNVCVLLRGFGHDTHQSQPEWKDPDGVAEPPPQGERYLLELGFFQPAVESIPAEALQPENFPNPPNPPLRFPMQAGDDQMLDARAWRHPFTVNATGQAPLRAWMEAFVEQVEADVASIRLVHPGFPPVRFWRFYFDTEPFILRVGVRNGVRIPNYLAEHRQDPGSVWATWCVPGSPGWSPPNAYPGVPGTNGMTLEQMYDAVKEAYGWETEPRDEFQEGLSADHPENRSVMIWWMRIWARAADAVMDNCAYHVLRTKWPGVRYGNWDMSRVVGVHDATPWYMAPGPPGVPAADLPRCVVDPSAAHFAGPLTRHNEFTNPQGVLHYDVWAGIEQGHVVPNDPYMADSPFFYPLKPSQLSTGGGQFGHRQADLYVPDWPPEDDAAMVTTLRLNRHTIESIINSGAGRNYGRLAPWIPQWVADAAQTPQDPLPYYTNEGPQRALLAMLRGKNVPELLQWTAAQGDPAKAAWEHTDDVVDRVWKGEVASVTTIVGDEQVVEVHRPSTVEYTLRTESGADDTADLTGPALSTLPTVLQVEVANLGVIPEPPREYVCTGETGSPRLILDIFVEGWGENVAGGRVLVRNVSATPYVWDELPPYEIATPMPPPSRRFRARLESASNRDARFTYIDSLGRVTLRLLHDRVGPGPAPSRYDLVQVIPFWVCGFSEPGGGDSLAAADMNFDGILAPEDTGLFVDALAAGAALADVNLDGALDAADIDTFVDSYANSGP